MTLWKAPIKPRDDKPRPALFLDRDGVVIAQEHYLADPALVRLLPGVAQAMNQARQAGFLLIGVSNQSGLGRGLFGPEDLEKVMRRMDDLLALEGASFDSFHYCTHAPEQDCHCRKPRPGLLEEAQALHNLDHRKSWVIGDKKCDVELGRANGLGSVLVRTGYGAAEEAEVNSRWGHDSRVLVADGLPGAVSLVLESYPPEGSL